jgi:GTP-binding protein
MPFIDHVQITVKAGDGGRGCSSFAHPPYTRHPYPDGGDGGDGGHVLLRADPNVATLLDFQFRHEFHAGRGGHGGSNTKTGRRGDDLLIRVPVGTIVHDADAGVMLRDLAAAGEQALVAKGGRGGLGNGARAASHGAAAPETQAAEAGERRRLILELKLIADVGLIGAPNAGKSSLLGRLSSARPKVAAYPFTTRHPVLGVVTVGERGSFVACDIPGLIEGAHAGKGLGMQFLRHIERTRLLVHVVDAAAVDGRDPVQAYRDVNREIASYDPSLAERPQLVAANKMDLAEARANADRLRREIPAPVWPISCATGSGISALRDAVWRALRSRVPV